MVVISITLWIPHKYLIAFWSGNFRSHCSIGFWQILRNRLFVTLCLASFFLLNYWIFNTPKPNFQAAQIKLLYNVDVNFSIFPITFGSSPTSSLQKPFYKSNFPLPNFIGFTSFSFNGLLYIYRFSLGPKGLFLIHMFKYPVFNSQNHIGFRKALYLVVSFGFLTFFPRTKSTSIYFS